MRKSYSELITLPSFLERYNYLQMNGVVADPTFGTTRFLNQDFYRSQEWRSFRNSIIMRDQGLDLGIDGREICGPITIHHIVPITVDMIMKHSRLILDPDNVISTSSNTHKAIHYGDDSILVRSPQLIERKPNDTVPWRS